MKKVCGAKLRGKDRTCQKAPMANGRCRLHGGATPNGPDSANYKHGRYADVFKGKMADRFQRAQADTQPMDLLPELYAQRAVFETYLDEVGNRQKLKLNELLNAAALAQDVVRTGTMITKIRSDQALTIAEIKFFQKSITLLLEKYVPDPDNRRNFIEELSALIPGGDQTAEDEAAVLPARAGKAS